MEEKYVIVGILTRDFPNTDMYLTGTINSLLENTNFSKRIEIHVYHNGDYTSPINQTINSFVNKYSDKAMFSFRMGGQYRGVEYGIDMINEWTQNHTYCVLLEGEWVTIPENKDWLNNSLKFMEENEVDQLLLYPYEDDNDNIERDENGFVFLKEFKYTNKPHIRRNKSFFDNGIFPLQEYNGETKPLKSAWLKDETMIPCEDFLKRMNYKI